jgi:hypothetical protein
MLAVMTNLEDDIADVKDTEHGVVIVASQVQVSLEASETSIADVCTV